MSKVTIRAMLQEDSVEVGRLLRSSFSSDLHPYIVYCQPRIYEYLSLIVTFPKAYPSHNLYVAESSDGSILGFSELRAVSPTACLLSYICVAADGRGMGLAEQLLLTHLDLHPEITRIQLDVFAHNAAAMRLYSRLGFTQTDAKRWWQRLLPDPPAEESRLLEILNWHTFQASARRYGFGVIQCRYAGDMTEVGMTSPWVVRAGTLEVFNNDDLLGQLRSFLPEATHALLIGGALNEGLRPSMVVLDAHRLEADARTIRASHR